MERLLLYVHFNKYNNVSEHVLYQLKKIRPLFKRVVFISNSEISPEWEQELKKELVDQVLLRKNIGFDFAAWRDGMRTVGFEELKSYDSVTLMNDTCFGPLWDLEPIYRGFEEDEKVDFWGMTNFRQTKDFPEHIQSYYLSFKNNVVKSAAFQNFWQNIQDFTEVQDVIDHYETQVTTNLTKVGFCYQTVFNTLQADASGMLYPDFSYYNPTAILNNRVPFIKVKTIAANEGLAPYLLNEIERLSNYPVSLIVKHMSRIGLPDSPYLLSRKLLDRSLPISLPDKKVAVHLHVFYVDLLDEFLQAFKNFHFSYDLFITTDSEQKKQEIQSILQYKQQLAQVFVTGNVGRDVLPMLKLKEQLSNYDYIGHFHTKKSKEADFWAGESWRKELFDMLVYPADQIVSQLDQDDSLGLVIADIPSFFRFNRIVVAWNEALISPEMNKLWERMNCQKEVDFRQMNTFVMSYGTFVWFKYDALSALFDLNLTDEDVPAEPLPQNSILHAIERLLVYIAWDKRYDFKISQNQLALTAFIDNKQLNNREDLQPHTFVDFNQIGGLKGALKYIFIGPARAIKYILKRLLGKVKS